MKQCDKPPIGWFCTRPINHDGPCAAHPSEDIEKQMRIYYQDLIYKICNIIDPVFTTTTIIGTFQNPSIEILNRIHHLMRET